MAMMRLTLSRCGYGSGPPTDLELQVTWTTWTKGLLDHLIAQVTWSWAFSGCTSDKFERASRRVVLGVGDSRRCGYSDGDASMLRRRDLWLRLRLLWSEHEVAREGRAELPRNDRHHMGVQLAMSVLNPRRRGRLHLLWVGLLTCSCNRGEPLELRPPTTCRTPELVSCLQPYSFRKLEPDQLRRLVEEVPHCLATNDRALLERQTSCMPLLLGKDQNDLPVELAYACPWVYLRVGPLPIRQGQTKGPCPAPRLP